MLRPSVLAVTAVLMASSATACTLLGAGAKATADGSAIVGTTMDSMATPVDLRLVRVPSMKHKPGAKRPVYNDALHHGYPRFVSADRGPGYLPANGSNQTITIPMGYIPQVNSTYAYWDGDFGMQNEVQLSIAETTCSARTVGYPLDMPNGRNLMNIGELTRIALERCDTAVCAVKTMGSLAEEHGFYGEYSRDQLKPGYSSSSEALMIADKYQNVWMFHILTGAHNSGAIWAAQRLSDDQFTIVPNTFVIRTLNLTDSANYLASTNVTALAYSMGWASPSKPFDFTAAYGFDKGTPNKPLYSGRRMWRAYDIVAPSLHLDPDVGFHSRVATYPFSVKPDAPIKAVTIMRIFSDYYQNTTYDLTKGISAGPFHDPERYGFAHNLVGNWERSISIARATHSTVLQTRPNLPDAVGGVAWYGQGVPADTVFFPISCGQESLPKVFNQALRSKFDSESTWWAFHFTSNWAHLRYDTIHTDIKAERTKYIRAALDLQNATEATCQATNASTQDCVALLEATYNSFIVNTTKAWWSFAWHLVSSYNAGYHFFNESSTGGRSIGYPADWANQTDYVLYPQHYSPPAQVAAEANMTAAVDPETGVVSVLVGSSSTKEGDISLPDGFVLGFVCGTMSLSVLVAIVAVVGRVRQAASSGTAKDVVQESSDPKKANDAQVVSVEQVAVL